jgi:alkanesulfonate monooxygenase SsuD/methylene tetrahydromethanopterin reductase-like flavin-dependent oxidoreductase (luciferase family)
MEFGLQIANIEWQALRDTAQMAEGLGFHSMMLPDHILYEGPEKQGDPHHLAYDPILQAAVIAESTKKMRVGHLVLCNLFRHPWFTAQGITSVDHISGGRAFLGLGTGWTETEFRMSGITFPDITTRLRMLDEALSCIRSLWTQEHSTLAGEFYQLKDAIQAGAEAASTDRAGWRRQRTPPPRGQARRLREHHQRRRQSGLHQHGEN